MHIKAQSFERKKYFYLAWGIFLGLLILVTNLLPFNGLYGQDSHEYFRFSQHLQSVLLSGTPVGEFFYPVMYPLIGAILGFVLPDVAALQGISLASFWTSHILEKMP